MISLKKSKLAIRVSISVALYSSLFAADTTPYQIYQDYIKKGLEVAQEYQQQILVASVSAAAAAYVGYAIYLDGIVNDKNSLWYWSMHHIKDGIIDQVALIEHTQERYPDLKSLHPLTAIFAMGHTAQIEIETCLTLRGIVKNLNNVHLGWMTNETIASLDKKLECLYILKIMLLNCTIETRTKCKKRAQL